MAERRSATTRRKRAGTAGRAKKTGKRKRTTEGRGGSGVTRLWIAPLLVVLAAVATLLLDRETGVLPLLELRAEAERVGVQVSDLRAERDRLRGRVVALQGDPLEIEALAREQLGMVRPGERVLRWAGAD